MTKRTASAVRSDADSRGCVCRDGGVGMSASEIVVVYRCGVYAEVVEHLVDRRAHRAGAAHIVFDVLGVGMVRYLGLI